MSNKFLFGNIESYLYELGIRVTGHKHYYDQFFSQANLRINDMDNVLDAGCGGGLLAVGLLNEYVKKRNINAIVHAFDISPSMLNLAEANILRNMVRENIRLYRANGQDLSNVEEFGTGNKTSFHDDSFDLVMSSGMLEYVPEPEKAICEMMRVLKPERQLVLSFVNDSLLGRIASRLWKFKILPKEYLFEQFYGIKDFQKFDVDSYNFYMKSLKSIYIGQKG